MAGGSDSEEPPAASSYWYDACEDGASLLCGIDFAASADFHPGIIPAIDCGADDVFVAEIDRILESINADPTPATPTPAPASLPPPPQDAAAVVANNAAPVVDNVQTSQSAELWKEPRRELPVAAANGGGGELRDGKRQRLAAGAPRHDWRRPPLPPPPAPSRGWEDRRGRRDYDRSRKRDRDCHAGRRETRGFWERDRRGKMVFRHGSWEADASRDTKRARTQDAGATETKKADADRSTSSQKEKPVTEEHARQYQLEVLEQAKSRNTIAFLETGAGKTLIAVLLIKSICDKMLKENKKILAIFLVPKVPLVYQVKSDLSVSELQELLTRI
jgi:endoribonuclease Dicer